MQFHFKDALRIQSVFVCFYAVKFSPLKIGTGTIPEPAPLNLTYVATLYFPGLSWVSNCKYTYCKIKGCTLF